MSWKNKVHYLCSRGFNTVDGDTVQHTNIYALGAENPTVLVNFVKLAAVSVYREDGEIDS